MAESQKQRFMFEGKRIRAKAVGQVTISKPSAAGNPTIAVPFEILPGQKAVLKQLPDDEFIASAKGRLDYLRKAPIDSVIDLPEGYIVTYMHAILKDNDHVIRSLRNAGWGGKSFAALVGGAAEGLGSVEVNLVMKIENDPSGTYGPKMIVDYVNSTSVGLAFVGDKAATPEQLASLDKQLSEMLNGGARSTSAGGTASGNGGANLGTKPSERTASAPPEASQDENVEDIPF